MFYLILLLVSVIIYLRNKHEGIQQSCDAKSDFIDNSQEMVCVATGTKLKGHFSLVTLRKPSARGQQGITEKIYHDQQWLFSLPDRTGIAKIKISAKYWKCSTQFQLKSEIFRKIPLIVNLVKFTHGHKPEIWSNRNKPNNNSFRYCSFEGNCAFQ